VKSRKKVPTVPRSPRITEADAARWYEGGHFSFDWTSWHFPNWIELLKKYRTRKARVLEIGSWEGRSATFFLNYLPRCSVVCIDTFKGGLEHRESRGSSRFLRNVETRFDANIEQFGGRVEKIKARSADALAKLGVERRQFDLAYIDGSHLAADVYSDAVLTWPLIVRGGLMIFDDYLWDGSPSPLEMPKRGIDAFLRAVAGNYRTALKEYQVAILKR
jgi:predicted O-methyltransferase YrrM